MDDRLLKVATSFLLGGLVSLVTITEARLACIYAFVILTVALFAGVAILNTFGISYGALRIAGGMTVALLGHRMLFGSVDAIAPQTGRHSFAFFPLALPGIAGPGAIATVIGVSTEIAEIPGGERQAAAYVATVASIAITCLVMWSILRSARMVSRWLGEEGINVITRLTGFLLVCIGVQFVGSGVRTFMAGA